MMTHSTSTSADAVDRSTTPSTSDWARRMIRQLELDLSYALARKNDGWRMVESPAADCKLPVPG
jgi:uncharacterized lipoprotein YmbA